MRIEVCPSGRGKMVISCGSSSLEKGLMAKIPPCEFDRMVIVTEANFRRTWMFKGKKSIRGWFLLVLPLPKRTL